MMKPLMPDVIVNGETISSAAIAAEAQNHNAPTDKPGWAWQAAARAMVFRSLLLQEAANMGLQPDPIELGEGKQETEDESLIRQVTEQKIVPQEITEDDCRKIFDKQPDIFRSPDLFQPSHMLFPARPEDKQARAEALQNAKAVLAEVLANPKSFGNLAKQYSACPSKDQGGQLGQVNNGDTVPEFEAVLNILSENEIHPEPV